MFGEGVGDELAVGGRDHRLDVGLAHPLHLLGRHDDVESVRSAAGVLLHPVEVAREVLGGAVAHRAEDAEPSRPGDRGGHRRERREAEDGVFDPQPLAQLRLHAGQDAAGGRAREEIF